MLARAAAICGDSAAARRIWGGTFHAVAHRLIAEHARRLGLAAVSVLDPGDVTDLIDLLRDDHGLTATGRRRDRRLPRAATLADVYSRAVNTGRPARAGHRHRLPVGASRTPTPSARCCGPSSPASASAACSTSTTCC